MSTLPNVSWQKVASFPDWKGEPDNSLAMNSMIGFLGYHGQGTLWLDVAPGVEGFDLYINTDAYDTASLGSGVHCLDYSASAIDGINTLQITNIRPGNLTNAVTVCIPYPVALPGSFAESGIRPEALRLVEDLIASDVAHGFPSASLAIIRNGRLVYENAWGRLNAYYPGLVRRTPSKSILRGMIIPAWKP